MLFGMPTLPAKEHPEREATLEQARKIVARRFREFGLSFDVTQHPQLLSRLAELGSHFDDSVDIASITRAVWPKVMTAFGLKQEDLEQAMLAALLHDVGKSGPLEAGPALSEAIRRLFVTPKPPFNPYESGRKKTVSEFVAFAQLKGAETIKRVLREAGMDPDTEGMIDFWRRHAEWTHDVLSVEPGVDQRVDVYASTHHLLEGKNPAHADPASPEPGLSLIELSQAHAILSAIDKYQAFRERSGETHESTINKLKAIVDGCSLPESGKKVYRKMIDILERHFSDS